MLDVGPGLVPILRGGVDAATVEHRRKVLKFLRDWGGVLKNAKKPIEIVQRTARHRGVNPIKPLLPDFARSQPGLRHPLSDRFQLRINARLVLLDQVQPDPNPGPPHVKPE